MQGTIVSAEFVEADDEADDDKLPAGTYVTIRLDGSPRISAGRVVVNYVDDESNS